MKILNTTGTVQVVYGTKGEPFGLDRDAVTTVESYDPKNQRNIALVDAGVIKVEATEVKEGEKALAKTSKPETVDAGKKPGETAA